MINPATPEGTPTFQVVARAFSSKSDKTRPVANFANYQDALTLAANRTLADLTLLCEAQHSARDLFDLWLKRGDDFSIVPDDRPAPFSSTDFARLIAPRLTSDQSRPLLIQVTCTDCLLFASGGFSQPGEWTFWVKAPATYTDATHLLRRAADELYDEMSVSSMRSEGSRYCLLELNARELSPVEANVALQLSENQTVYTVQNDGTFAKTVP